MLKTAKCILKPRFLRNYAKSSKNTITNQEEMKYLNVAEKHDAAKTIAGLLSNGTARRREGYSVYNKIFDFEATVKGRQCKMVMTSVSGHLLSFSFLQSYRNWKNVDPIALFDAPVRKVCPEDYQPIKRTLEREIRNCGGLIIWTDCDREGENIGFEIIQVCRDIKANITVYRAVFSEITTAAVHRALQQLKEPDKRQNEAVDIRSELDLRTGAAITRFQTMRFQRLFPSKIADNLISYGSCQIPTLGFVVERYKEIEAFVSEPFWKIKVIHTIDDLTVEFNWERNRLFDKQTCEDYFLLCITDPKATVEVVNVKPKSKWRPTPLDTVELEKLGSRKLKLSAKETMTIAEKLYTKGIISYPRTETNQFSKEIDLRSLVEQQTGHGNWGSFAERVLEWGPNPRNGNKSDQAHPPIHPTKLVTNLDGNDGRVYELICRHFLACISKDALGTETVVKINIAGEKFTATGLVILERNYLDVYVYDKWSAKQIHNYVVGQVFEPTEITMPEGATMPPSLLTEADLIALMEKNGIGTDATHAEHINTIKERGYIGVIDNGHLVPGVIGMGLCEGYDAMQLALAKPVLRAEFEADLKRICLGQKDSKSVLREQIVKYKEAYKQIMEKITAMDEKMALRINETLPARQETNSDNTTANFENNANRLQEIFKCPKCNIAPMALRPKKNQSGYLIGCLNFPECKNVIWLPTECKEPIVKDEICPKCGEGYKLLKFKFSNAYHKTLFNAPSGWYKTCICCDTKFRDTFDINLESVKRLGAIVGTTTSRSTAGSSSEIATTSTINTSRPGNSNTSSNSGGNANPSNIAECGNKKKSTDKGNSIVQTKRTKKAASTVNQTGTTGSSIRNYFTSAIRTENPSSSNNTPASSITSTVLNDIEDIFNSNDSFDIAMPAERNEQTENIAEFPTANNDFNLDIAEVFENDDNEDWGLIESSASTSNVDRNRTDSTNANSRVTNQRHDSISESYTFNDMDDSISELFRSDINYNNFAWGSGSRKLNDNPEPDRKRVRLEKNQTTTIPTTSSRAFDSTSNNNTTSNYSWGRAERTTAEAPHGVKCSGCHQDAKELFVKRDGPNKGKMFYACPKDKQCKFFQWADGQSNNISREEISIQPTTSWGASQDSWSSQSWGTASQRSSNTGNGASTSSAAGCNRKSISENKDKGKGVQPTTSWRTSQNSWGSQSWGSGSQTTSNTRNGASTSSASSTYRKSTLEREATSINNSIDQVKCNCGTEASSFTVRKDGPNKGRPFYSCPQRSCGFFQWADNCDNNESTSFSSNSDNQNMGWGTGNSTNSDLRMNNEREGKKRKCGLCRQEGHTKVKCPRKAEFDFFS